MGNGFWWILHKDLVVEFRARRAWPTMLLLGIATAVVFSIQLASAPEQKRQFVGAMIWLTVFFAGTSIFERSFAAEREEGCWDSLRLAPASASAVYLAKTMANWIALIVLESVLIPLFFALSDLPLARCAAPLALVAVLAALGLAAAGTLIGALGLGRSGHVLALVVMPLSIPVLLAASASTRLAVDGAWGDAWWRWIQFLGAFAAVYLTAGIILFEYATED